MIVETRPSAKTTSKHGPQSLLSRPKRTLETIPTPHAIAMTAPRAIRRRRFGRGQTCSTGGVGTGYGAAG